MEHILEILNKFPEQKIGVIGDFMLDRYLFSEVSRISPEAPVPVAKVISEKYVLGGAANVAANVRGLGGAAEIFGLIGDDSKGELMQKIFREQGIGYGLCFEAQRPTTVKTRIMAANQQIVRVDREKCDPISPQEEERLIGRLPAFLDKVGAVVVSDYDKGLVTENFAKKIIELARERGIKVLSDPVPETFGKFAGSYLIKPNKKEAELISGMKFTPDYSNVKEIAEMLRQKLNSDLIITLGKDGMIISAGGASSRVPTIAKEVYDVSGAGDTVMAALALGTAAGGDLETVALVGNYCAGVVVGKIGTAIASVPEILELIKENGPVSYAKII